MAAEWREDANMIRRAEFYDALTFLIWDSQSSPLRELVLRVRARFAL
jgi:hypothetical protein